MKGSLQRIMGLIRKELLAVLKDKRTHIILIVPAIVQSIVFGYAATYDLSDVPYAVLDQSHSDVSTELLGRLDGTGVFKRVATLQSSTQAAAMIDKAQALLVITFPPTLASDLNAGHSASIQVLADGRNSTTANSALAYIGAVVSAHNAQRGWVSPGAIRVESRAWFNPNLETRWNLVPGLIASLSMLQTLLLTALSVAREREEGTFDQLLVTPINPVEIMVGKAIPSILIGLAQAILIFCVSRFWFQIPFAGSYLTLSAGLLLFMTASVGLGLSISAMSSNMQQAMLYTFVMVMPMMLLSGLTTPVSNMPEVFQIVTWINPLRFAIDLVQRVYLEGVPMSTVSIDLLPMLLIATLTLPLATWLFRNKLA